MFPGRKHTSARNSSAGSRGERFRAGGDTGRDRGVRYSRISFPRIPLSAIFSFAIVGFGGALFLSYTAFDTGEGFQFARPTSDGPAYSARAIARKSRNAAIPDPRPGQTGPLVPSDETGTKKVSVPLVPPPSAIFSSSARGQLRGVDAFAEFKVHAAYPGLGLAITGVPAASQASFSAVNAPDFVSGNVSAVPEPSTWLSGLALLALVGVRCIHARYRRRQRLAQRRSAG